MSNLNQPESNPVQQQGDLQQQQQQSSPDAMPQADDEEELDTAADEETPPGEGLVDADSDEQTDQVRQTQASQQSDAEPVEGDIYRGAPKDEDAESDTASR